MSMMTLSAGMFHVALFYTVVIDNKYSNLMTGPKGNSEFCFPEMMRSKGNKTHCFPRGQPLSVLLYLPTQN